MVARPSHTMLMRIPLVLLVCLLGLFHSLSEARAQDDSPITVFAAASLKTALEDIAQSWTGAPLRFSFAGSSTLARQIRDGAPADIFISANTEWIEALNQAGLIDPGSVQTVAENQLVFLGHDAAKLPGASITKDSDLPNVIGQERLAMALVESVPAGQYGKEALIHFGWWPALQGRVVQTDNVRAALTLVIRGEARFGIVYASDAAVVSTENVQVLATFPAQSHRPIQYPGAVIKRAGTHPEARSFLEHLIQPVAQERLTAFGFGTGSAERRLKTQSAESSLFELTEAEWTALSLSLKVSFWATLATLPFGLLVAYALARGQFWGKQALNGFVHLPLILPPVVTGYGLLILFGRQGAIGQMLFDWFGITIVFEWTGAVLAAGVMAFPLMVRAMRLAIEAVDPKLEQAARTLGANRLWTFGTVTLPLMLPGIITGAILAFAKAMGEFGATITFVSNIPGETQTLPSAIYAFLQVPDGETPVYRMVIASIIVAIGALLISEWVSTRVARRIAGR